MCTRTDRGMLLHGVALGRAREDARRYFPLLDGRASPRLMQMEPAMVAPVVAVWAVLRRRLRQRCERRVFGPGATPLSPHGEPADVGAVSRLMLGALTDVFGKPLGNSDRLIRLGAAHDVFSWGGVHRRHTEPAVERSNMTPDGAAIFMFPEFGHLAVEMGIDTPEWTALLPILTRMPALYVRAHELSMADLKPRFFDDYGPPPDVAGLEPELVAYAEKLAAEHHGLGVGALGDALDRLVHRALAQESA